MTKPVTSRGNVARRLEEEIANAGVPPCSDQVPPLEKDVNDDHAPVNSHPLRDEAIKAALFKIVQAITTKIQATTTQAQAMSAQANWESVPRAHQQVATMDSHLRDFTRMNPPAFYGSKV
ncbi:hypothetical protein EJD97_023704 [Solanum chilense]|uniref:Uncharacterized protein n=1 Tax=Solanum chilense TaxID=4083 RepID=A0A6N2C3J6_SOLCI|nr:hypothetical protein EJD97_023704 [Solanum chilense]